MSEKIMKLVIGTVGFIGISIISGIIGSQSAEMLDKVKSKIRQKKLSKKNWSQTMTSFFYFFTSAERSRYLWPN